MGYLAQHFNQCADKASLIREARIEAKRLSELIAEFSKPILIILIGSAADSSFHLGSDIDLVIVYPDQSSLVSAKKNLARARLKPKFPVDYLFCTKDHFDRQKNLGGPYFIAYHEGIILHDQGKTL